MAKEKALVTNETTVTAEFFDVDAMNVVWHGNYVKFLEIARCQLLDKIGYGYMEMVKDGYAFPITTLELKYVKSLHFNEKAVIRTSLVEYENRVKIRYEIFNQEGQLVNKAETTQMAMKLDSGESEFITPERFRRCVERMIEKQE